MLREHQIYANFSKCDLFKDKIQYLGHIITKDGILVDPDKIKSINEWPVPKDVTDVGHSWGSSVIIEGSLRDSQGSPIP